jgi:hypothetical protein
MSSKAIAVPYQPLRRTISGRKYDSTCIETGFEGKLVSGGPYILFAEPPRRGENGPALTEQVRPHVAVPYGKSAALEEMGLPELSWVQWDVLLR